MLTRRMLDLLNATLCSQLEHVVNLYSQIQHVVIDSQFANIINKTSTFFFKATRVIVTVRQNVILINSPFWTLKLGSACTQELAAGLITYSVRGRPRQTVGQPQALLTVQSLYGAQRNEKKPDVSEAEVPGPVRRWGTPLGRALPNALLLLLL
jgi:hypothetical protein